MTKIISFACLVSLVIPHAQAAPGGCSTSYSYLQSKALTREQIDQAYAAHAAEGMNMYSPQNYQYILTI